MKKQRSAAYPFWSIPYCLDFCSLIYKNFGKYRATREQIAKALNVSVGTLSQKIGSSVQYNLLDMKPTEGYLITPLFSKWNRPISDEQKTEALIDIFTSPPLYASLIATFENDILPQTVAMSNILYQDHSISESACERAASVFIENARELGFISGEGMLILDGNIKTEKNNLNESKGSSFDVEENDETRDHENNTNNNLKPVVIEKDDFRNESKYENQKNNNEHQKPIPYNIPLKGKLPAQLLVPGNIESRDFEFIIDFVNLMKRQFD